MSKFHDDRYDEIKSLLKKSRFINEDKMSRINIGKSIEDKISQDTGEYETADNVEKDEKETPTDKVQRYRISGGILALHGKEKKDLDITTDDKIAFQETMDEFVEEVSDLVDFNQLNVYTNNVEWSGKVIDKDIEFVYTIGEESGVYINGNTVKVDEEFLDFLTKLNQYYEKFRSKWSRVLASRKTTNSKND